MNFKIKSYVYYIGNKYNNLLRKNKSYEVTGNVISRNKLFIKIDNLKEEFSAEEFIGEELIINKDEIRKNFLNKNYYYEIEKAKKINELREKYKEDIKFKFKNF